MNRKTWSRSSQLHTELERLNLYYTSKAVKTHLTILLVRGKSSIISGMGKLTFHSGNAITMFTS